MLWWVMLAGGLGSGARYLVGLWAFERMGSAFPSGTLIVNLLGCFMLGAVAHLATASAWHPELRGAVAIGFLGGFPTYSSFNQETLALMSTGATSTALTNIGITLAGGLVAAWLGMLIARQFTA